MDSLIASCVGPQDSDGRCEYTQEFVTQIEIESASDCVQLVTMTVPTPKRPAETRGPTPANYTIPNYSSDT